MNDEQSDICWYFTEPKKLDEARRVFALIEAVDVVISAITSVLVSSIDSQDIVAIAARFEEYLKSGYQIAADNGEKQSTAKLALHVVR